MEAKHVYATLSGGVGWGVMWAVWPVHGFWWSLVYGLFWPAWFGYRIANMLLAAYVFGFGG